MKKIAVLLLLAVAFDFAEHLQWSPATILLLEEGYLSFDRGKLCGEDSLSSLIHCSDDNAIAYYSTLDSDYVVFVYARGIGVWGVHEELTESYPYQTTLAQILEYEWMELWRWGLMDISEDSASTLISRILSEYSNLMCRKQEFGTHQEETSDTIVVVPSVIGGCLSAPLALFALLPELETERLETHFPLQGLKVFKVERTRFFLSGVKDGAPFKAFDLNGVLLDRGNVRGGMVNVPKIPAVLEVGGQRLLVR